MAWTIVELAQRLGATLAGGTEGLNAEITAVQPVKAATEHDLTFVADGKHEGAAKECRAGAVLVTKPIDGLAIPQLVVENVDAALIEVLGYFAPQLKPPAEGVDASARVGENVRLGPGSSIGPNVVIADDVEIGANTVLGSGCYIGEGSKIGSDCRLDSNVTVYHQCTIGNHVILQSGVRIGSIGFGYSFLDGSHRLVPHNGGVVLADFVEIGANTCVDRAKFGNTMVGAGTKIDNLVQIGHNVVIGKCCLIAAQVGVAGSCRLGNGVVLAGQVGLADNIEIGDGAMIGAQSGVISNVAAGKKLAWTPAVDVREAARVVANIFRLPTLSKQVKRLTAKVEELEAAKDHTGRG
ncbi:MAG: UDP-3-O-(3-hydroxymyristoyl)glucosamine N-acyltransferase [Phycisphaerales bacterium]|nr:MAG: UDP-3-O-(3-hydroxymyristoyl)glucosamine N-acyltransferase [Phycisphaerales bacterium]